MYHWVRGARSPYEWLSNLCYPCSHAHLRDAARALPPHGVVALQELVESVLSLQPRPLRDAVRVLPPHGCKEGQSAKGPPEVCQVAKQSVTYDHVGEETPCVIKAWPVKRLASV